MTGSNDSFHQEGELLETEDASAFLSKNWPGQVARSTMYKFSSNIVGSPITVQNFITVSHNPVPCVDVKGPNNFFGTLVPGPLVIGCVVEPKKHVRPPVVFESDRSTSNLMGR